MNLADCSESLNQALGRLTIRINAALWDLAVDGHECADVCIFPIVAPLGVGRQIHASVIGNERHSPLSEGWVRYALSPKIKRITDA